MHKTTQKMQNNKKETFNEQRDKEDTKTTKLQKRCKNNQNQTQNNQKEA